MQRRRALGGAFALVAALLLGAALARAEPTMPPGHPHGSPPWTPPDERLEAHLRELGLDAEKLAAIQSVLASARKSRAEIDARLMSAFDEMRNLLDQDAPDEGAVMAQADRLGAIRTEGRKLMLRTLLRVRAELAPEQRTRLKEMMQRDFPHGGPGMRRGAPGSPPEGL